MEVGPGLDMAMTELMLAAAVEGVETENIHEFH